MRAPIALAACLALVGCATPDDDDTALAYAEAQDDDDARDDDDAADDDDALDDDDAVDDDDGADDDDAVDDDDTPAPTDFLSLVGRREEFAGAPFTSTRLNSWFEVPNDAGTWVRARLKMTMRSCEAPDPYPNGPWPAFWLLGADCTEQGYDGTVDWPGCGEIDIIEWIAPWDATHYETNQWGDPVFPVDHFQVESVPYPTGAGPETWHTYGVRFNGDTITYTFNGVDQATKLYNDADEHTHRIILNLAIGGNLGGPVTPAFVEDRVTIDWVRIVDGAGTVLWADEMDDEATTRANWFPHVGTAYNNELQYYTEWDPDNVVWHTDATIGECP